MEIYTKAEGKIKEIADKYRRGREAERVLSPIEFDGERYSEVIYNSVFLGKMGKEVKGTLYINEKGEVLTDRRLMGDVAGLAYLADIFFNPPSLAGLKGAITTELQTERENNDYNLMLKALEYLREQSVQGTEVVVDVIRKLPESRRQSNRALQAVVDRVDALISDSLAFTPSMLAEVNRLYTDALIANFQRVKLIARGIKSYDDIKKEASTRKKKTKTKARGKDVSEGLTRLETGILHFTKILMVYEKVLDINQSQYLNFLKQIEKEKIQDRVKMNRA